LLFSQIKSSLVKNKVTKGNSGYSLVEIIVAMSMSATLGIAASAVVIWGINISARTQANISLSAQTEIILNNFESTLRDSDTITSAMGTQMSYTFQRNNNCELHTYAFSTTNGVTSLIHTVRAGTLPNGNYCSDIQASLVAGTTGNQTSQTEANNLGATSGFNYWSSDGQRSLLSGETGYDVTKAIALCRIGAVTINLITSPQKLDKSSTSKTETITTDVRANNYGLTC